MTVSFNNIPAGNNIRVPLFYAEMDNSQANVISLGWKTLLIGQKLTAGSQANNTPVAVSSVSQAKALFGVGSMLARMVEIYRNSDLNGELWCMAVNDAGGGTNASGTITAAGTASAAGSISLYIAGQKISVAVASGDTATVVATNINAAINAATDLPVTSTVATNTVTLTCRWKGATGNDISMQDSFRGAAGGEALPTGVGLTYSGSGFLTAGATNPTLSGAPITALGDDQYDFIIHPYNDTASMDALATEMNDSSGRWSYSRQVYGHCYTALRGTYANLLAAGAARNDQHNTIAAIDVDCPHPNWEYAAAYGARNAIFISIDPARPTQTGELTGLLAPRAGKRFLWSERNSLLGSGIATSMINVGAILIERAITTYQKNTFGQGDTSYLDSETLHTSAYILRYLRTAITSKYPRHKLANDGTRFGAGQAIVTPSVARGEILAAYTELESQGIVENRDLLNTYLIVERNSSNPSRLDVLLPPDYVNQLRIFAVLDQFRLQYPASATAA